MRISSRCVLALTFLIIVLSNTAGADQITLVANSTGGSGDYGLMAGENLYNNGYLFAAQGTPTVMNASGLTYISANDTYYIKLAGSATADSRWRANFTLANVQSVQWINITGIINTAASDTTHMGIKNATGYQKLKVTTVVGTNRYETLSINISGSNSTQYSLAGNTLTFSTSLWTNGAATNTYTRLDMVSAVVTYTVTAPDTTFTVSLVNPETTMDFNPANNNSKNVQPDSQVISTNIPWAFILNGGNVALTFKVNTTVAQPSWVDVSISNSSTMSGNISLSSTSQIPTGWASIAAGDEVRLFALANFTTAVIGTTQRTLEIDSS